MRNLDSVLFEIGEPTTGVSIEPIPRRALAAASDRVHRELRHTALAVIKLTVAVAITVGLAILYQRLYRFVPAYATATTPLVAAILAALWTTTLRLCVEPRATSAPTLLVGALLAYPAAWSIRAIAVGAGWPSFDWVFASKAADLGELSSWVGSAVAVELGLTVAFGLFWTRWFLGPQKRPG